MKTGNIVILLLPLFLQSQWKDGITIVQASADFVKESNLEIKKLKHANVLNYDITKHNNFFKENKIEFIPTIVLFNNGKEVIRWESNIMLELECTLKDLQNEIDKLIENKFL